MDLYIKAYLLYFGFIHYQEDCSSMFLQNRNFWLFTWNFTHEKHGKTHLTCQTPITALAMRIRRITRGSTKAVVVSSPSSNKANTYKNIQDKSINIFRAQVTFFPNAGKRSQVNEQGSGIKKSKLTSYNNQSPTRCRQMLGPLIPNIYITP